MELVVASVLAASDHFESFDNIDRLARKGFGNLRGQRRVLKYVIIPEQIMDSVDSGRSIGSVQGDGSVAGSDILVLDADWVLASEASTGVKVWCSLGIGRGCCCERGKSCSSQRYREN